VKPLTLAQLRNVWDRVIQDPDAHRALVRLERDGFRIRQLEPRDPTLKYPNWADYIAAIPLLPNRPSRRQIHRQIGLRKYSSLVSTIRRFAVEISDPFCQVSILSEKDCSLEEIRDLGQSASATSDFLEKFLSWAWYTRHFNPRNTLIAELRWRIRERTGKPHDRELATLIDAAFRAAGIQGGLYLDATTLDRIEKRENEGRLKASSRLRYRTGPGPISKSGPPSSSTRFPRNPRKRV
jgi:hypothetical protein